MLAGVVTEAARRWGDRTAFVAADGWTLSYADLDRASDEVAGALAAASAAAEDDPGVVALCLPSCPEHVIAYAAACKAGLITAGINSRLSPTERRAVLDRAQPRLVLTTPDLADPDAPFDTLLVEPSSDGTDVLAELRLPGASAQVTDDPDRPVAIVFTSGTTGTPKGAVFTGRQLDFITQVDSGGGWGPGGHTIGGTSLAHLGPTTKLPGNLMRGGTTHLLSRWTPSAAIELVERHRMAGIGGIPTQIALMLADPTLDDHDLSSLRAVVIGGGPSTPALVRQIRERLDAAVAVRYSCTEAGVGVGTTFDDPPEDAEESVGRPHDGVELTIRSEAGGVLPPGEVGEVCLRSRAVMTGYWRDAEATAAAFADDGSVRTGDLGHLDERGRLHLVGRIREMYVRGGYNVYPAEVEATLAEHPLVREVAVVPRPDGIMGEVGVAVVVPVDPTASPTLDDLRAFVGDRLAKHKRPEQLRLVDALPLTAMDKVDRQALVDVVALP